MKYFQSGIIRGMSMMIIGSMIGMTLLSCNTNQGGINNDSSDSEISESLSEKSSDVDWSKSISDLSEESSDTSVEESRLFSSSPTSVSIGSSSNGSTPFSSSTSLPYKPVIETGQQSRGPDQNKYISEELYKLYQVEDDDLTLTTKYTKGQIKTIERMDHGSVTQNVAAVNRFNRAVRRERTLLVTGDMPIFALAGDWPLVRSDPPMIKMGEFNLSVEIAGTVYGVLNADQIVTRHLPEGTEWTVYFDEQPNLSVVIKAVILDDHSIAMLMQTSGPDHKIIARYDRFELMARLTDASYFGNVKTTIPISQVHLTGLGGNTWDISFDSDSEMQEQVGIRGMAASSCSGKQTDGSVIFTTSSGSANEFAAVAFHAYEGVGFQEIKAKALTMETTDQVKEAVERSNEYYIELLSQASAKTESEMMDLGFKHAILNLDYGHVGKAWLEGGHYWTCYWANNFQISAAISLGYYDEAREALEFFGVRAGGYSIVSASGQNFGDPFLPSLNRTPIAYEGLPYYIYQLDQYVQHTGDVELIREVLPYLDKMADDMYAVSDMDENGVLGWKLHANTFLYQADHLQLPGDGASPTLMMTGMMDRLSRLARKAGLNTLEDKYAALSTKGTQNLLSELWSSDARMFFSHKDSVGISHTSHYYTDFVFPALYSTLGPEYTWPCLDQLINTLIYRSDKTGLLLMRVGNYKPSMFATDNVMPTQMAEAARAFFQEGYTDYAVGLMEAVAYGATVYTESPGSFPERLNDNGKGEANFMFGNPYGSYINTYVNGLWGISVTDDGKNLNFAPALPQEWKSGEIKLGYVEISFTGAGDQRVFHIKTSSEKINHIRLEISVNEKTNARLVIDGQEKNPTKTSRNGYMSMTWDGAFDGEITAEVKGSATALKEITREYQGGDMQENGVYLKPGIHYIYTPDKTKNIFVRNQITVHALPAIHQICLEQDKSGWVLIGDGEAFGFRGKNVDLTVEIQSVNPHIRKTIQVEVDQTGLFHFQIPLGTVEITMARAEIQYVLKSGNRQYTDSIDASVEGGRNLKQINIQSLLKDTTIQAMTGWRDAPYSAYLQNLVGSDYLVVSGDIFRVAREKSDGKSLMAVVNKGLSNRWTGVLNESEFAKEISIEINDQAGSISILMVSEIQARNMFATVGSVTICYSDDTEREIPLKAGVNVDFLRSSLGADCEPIKLAQGGGSDYAHVLRIGCDAEKTISHIKITSIAADFYIGLLALNIS